MLSMAQRIDSNSGSIHVVYDVGATTVLITASDVSSHHASIRLPVEEFDKIVEQYMYLRQYAKGRRAR